MSKQVIIDTDKLLKLLLTLPSVDKEIAEAIIEQAELGGREATEDEVEHASLPSIDIVKKGSKPSASRTYVDETVEHEDAVEQPEHKNTPFSEHEVPSFDNSDVIANHEADLAAEAALDGEEPVEKKAPARTHVAARSLAELEAEEAAPKSKMEYVVVLSVDRSKIQLDEDQDLVAWVIQKEEGMRVDTIPSRLATIKSRYESSKKAQKRPADTLGEVISLAPSKEFKEQGLAVKTKEACNVICVNPRKE